MSQSISESDFVDLIRDARRVAKYGQRVGLLVDDGLFIAIKNATAKQSLDWSHEEAVALQGEINKSVKAIQPVTLVDLQHWDPFDENAPRRSTIAGIARLAFVFLALLLILVCAHYTSWNKQSALLLSEISTAQSEQESAIIDRVIEWLSDKGESLNGKGRIFMESELESIGAYIEQIRTNNDRYASLLLRFTESMRAYAPWSAVISDIRTRFVAQDERVKPQAYDGGAPIQPDALQIVDRKQCQDQLIQYISESSASSDSGFTGNSARALIFVTENKPTVVRHLGCILGMNDIGNVMADERSFYQRSVRDLSNYLDFLGRWLLPGVYGALGAILFTMRSLLNPVYPDPRPVHVALRVFLGAFAGISVAWFWSSDLTKTMEISSVSVGLLTIAFLLGFAIDAFFALLDRLVRAASTYISKLGTSA